MRRSKAPSMVNKSKRFCNNLDNNAQGSSDPEDESYKWGSKDNPSAQKQNEYMNKNKRIFNIVWRDITTKKHKTWKGDGTLEVNVISMKAVLKDDTGKYMGCTTKFQLSELQEDLQLMVGGKEIEIQNEIKDEDEIYETRRNQIKNRNWGSEEWVSPEKRAEEDKKPKGTFNFKPVLVLKPPALQQIGKEETKDRDTGREYKWATETEGNISKKHNSGTHKLAPDMYKKSSVENSAQREEETTNAYRSFKTMGDMKSSPNEHHELMCFIKPSELQQYLFQQINEYYIMMESLNGDELNSLDIQHILEQICNHPSFIKHSKSSNKLVQFLTPSLPDWSDMGPFDSGKLEFVQYFLQTSGGRLEENVIIIANHLNALNMLQGLCDYMKIRCLRLNAQDPEKIQDQTLKEYLHKSEENLIKVLLTTSIMPFKDYGPLFETHHIIAFENILAIMNAFKGVNLKFAKIYYLITAFSVEEFLILPNLSQSIKDILNLVNADFDERFCYIHSKIECNCCGNIESNISNNESKPFNNWKHLAAPFDERFLKDSGLDNSAQNLITIFLKNQY